MCSKSNRTAMELYSKMGVYWQKYSLIFIEIMSWLVFRMWSGMLANTPMINNLILNESILFPLCYTMAFHVMILGLHVSLSAILMFYIFVIVLTFDAAEGLIRIWRNDTFWRDHWFYIVLFFEVGTMYAICIKIVKYKIGIPLLALWLTIGIYVTQLPDWQCNYSNNTESGLTLHIIKQILGVAINLVAPIGVGVCLGFHSSILHAILRKFTGIEHLKAPLVVIAVASAFSIIPEDYRTCYVICSCLVLILTFLVVPTIILPNYFVSICFEQYMVVINVICYIAFICHRFFRMFSRYHKVQVVLLFTVTALCLYFRTDVRIEDVVEETPDESMCICPFCEIMMEQFTAVIVLMAASSQSDSATLHLFVNQVIALPDGEKLELASAVTRTFYETLVRVQCSLSRIRFMLQRNTHTSGDTAGIRQILRAYVSNRNSGENGPNDIPERAFLQKDSNFFTHFTENARSALCYLLTNPTEETVVGSSASITEIPRKSDVDFMIIPTGIAVDESILIYRHANPCYLRIPISRLSSPAKESFRGRGDFATVKNLRDFDVSLFGLSSFIISMVPCSKVGKRLLNFDYVPQLKITGFPEPAMSFLYRKRQWPTTDVVSAIIAGDFHITARPCPVDPDPDHDCCLSFAKAEVTLCRSMTTSQKAFLVKVKKLKPQMNKKLDCLTSYHIKTAVFWFFENSDMSIFTHSAAPQTNEPFFSILNRLESTFMRRYRLERRLVSLNMYMISSVLWVFDESAQFFMERSDVKKLLRTVLYRLRSYFHEGFLPHYFVPKENLLAGISRSNLDEIATNIDRLLDDLTVYG